MPLIGSWHVSRRIVPFNGGPIWTFGGRAEIDARGFVEDGAMSTAGATIAAGRRYLLHRDRTGAALIHKHDGSFFAALGRDPVQVVSHLCGDDTYRGRFLFLDADRWVEIWRMRGPRKHYRSVSRYVRA